VECRTIGIGRYPMLVRSILNPLPQEFFYNNAKRLLRLD
jgi:hypothetical protein